MKLTVAISTHGGYERFLDMAVTSAKEYADEVVVYDDGGECVPPHGVVYVPLPKAGNLVPARLRAIQDCRTDYLLHLDADDWLCARPKLTSDIVIGNLLVCDVNNTVMGMWDYTGWPTDYQGALRRLDETRSTPMCSKMVCNTEWLWSHNLSWYQWPHTVFAEDCRTVLEYLKHNPCVDICDPFYVYRIHGEQDTANTDRAAFLADVDAYLKGEL